MPLKMWELLRDIGRVKTFLYLKTIFEFVIKLLKLRLIFCLFNCDKNSDQATVTNNDCLLQNVSLLAGHWTRLRPSLVCWSTIWLSMGCCSTVWLSMGCWLTTYYFLGRRAHLKKLGLALIKFMFQGHIFLIWVAFQVKPSN